MTASAPMIEADALCMKVRQATLLNNVTVQLRGGETVAIVGPNGAGKSTLLRSLSGDLRCTGGSVRLKGRDLASFSSRELANHRVMLSQHVNVSFPFTVEEIVAMGAGDRSRAITMPLVDAAIADVLASGARTRDIADKGANAVSTTEMGDAIIAALKRRA